MMLKQVAATAAITILGLVSAQDSPATPSVCAVGCVNGVFVNAANMGCASGDMLCVCDQAASFQGGIHDCIVAACASDGPDVQIPLANAYANEQCASESNLAGVFMAKNVEYPNAFSLPEAAAESAAPSVPTSSTAASPPEPTPAEVTSSTTPTAASSTSTPVPSAESSPQSTTTSSSVVSTTAASPTTSSSASDNESTTTQPVSPTTSASTSGSSSPTTSGISAPAATSSTSSTTTGLSTAVKAGIGAGVGAAALAAIIIAVCVCLRRRQRKKTANRVRNYKISEPMSASSSHFANEIGRAETTGLPRPIITTHAAHLDNTGMATSPTSVYSNASDLESHARRYEEMPPRAQPRTMI
ncbi:hypothetical protein CHU98_g7928 [Xylaria longipes]|nr:hypothetical protein CHU98_g7928 [Xylaria longipes]